MFDVWQNVPREQIGFLGMRVARQDEGFDPFGLIGAQFGEDLIGIADNRGTAARPRATDAARSYEAASGCFDRDAQELELRWRDGRCSLYGG